MIARLTFLLMALLLPVLLPVLAQAHEGRPLLIKITPQSGGVGLAWQAPPVLPAGAEPRVVLEGCTLIDDARATHGLVGDGAYDCPNGWAVAALNIIWPQINPALSTLVDIEGGETRFYGPQTTRIPLGGMEVAGTNLASFIFTGIEHILSGFDHLLFVLALTLVVWQRRDAARVKRLALMVTGFTLAHSLTLALSTFGLIKLAAAPVEATIALSILFVCVELARGLRFGRQDTLTWRYPALTASAFGLLHGLGFASVLNAASLGEGERLLGLLGFNLGVEIGQLAFVGVVLALGWLAAKLLPAQGLARATSLLVFAMGTLSATWMFERLMQF